ncbi:sulfatase family protein [Marinilabilia rubra]|uniref:Sulfatase N-terminal domain-containing protein n=1 Tax=Marinilabilia rubra TaxID=2162893 RepID=A0A2U2BC11_9BACT|nr:sulfatase-like hydrolase/transferase [Marinilabilia rubra]PWE00614.1 hypothetical protein DDZ16_03170 [Marinilabilia rubra]
MSKQLVLFAAFTLALISYSNRSEASKKSKESRLPNIVLLIGDDHGYPYFGFNDAGYMHTPNMDKLAERGTVFTNGYVPVAHCAPSLRTLMTGILPTEYDHWKNQKKVSLMETSEYQNLDADERKEWEEDFTYQSMKYYETLPRLLKQKGYKTWQGGKWWEFSYQVGGFDEGMTKGWTKEQKESDPEFFLTLMGGDGTELVRKTMDPVYDFIDKNKEGPFFLWFAPELPHWPFNAPQKYYDLYEGKGMTESAKKYYANCSWWDDGVGILMDYMEKKGLMENTIFIYVNDNGWEQAPNQEFRHDEYTWHLGGERGKGSFYDPSFRTPIIFSWPGKIETGVRKQDFMHSADITATILNYVGINIPDNFYGTSYTDVISGKENGKRDVIIGEIDNIRSAEAQVFGGDRTEGYFLRSRDWFFTWNKTKKEINLYNMHNDPFNFINLAAKYPEVIEEYKTQVDGWIKKYGSKAEF